MRKGQSPKMKGSICNIPIDCNAVCNTLPSHTSNNGLILLKLKRKLQYRGHVLFEPVRPEFVQIALQFLKENNFLYKEITIDTDSIQEELTDFTASNISLEGNDSVASDINEEEKEDPLDENRLACNHTMLVSNIPCRYEQNDQVMSIAPGEGKEPAKISTDEYFEELAFPHLFPTGRFGYQAARNVKLSPTKYFNQRLLNYKQNFASDPDYIFFACSVLQQLNLISSINIAMKKVDSTGITAGMFNVNYKQTIQEFLAADRGFSFMKNIKGSPAYWKNFLYDVLAMVKQLGLPTYFITLSCADLRWNELV